MSEPPSENEPEIGSKEWEARRQREIGELREKERQKAAEYEREKQISELKAFSRRYRRRKTVLPTLLILAILALPASLFIIGITAKPIGYRHADRFEIDLGANPEDNFPAYDPIVEAARGLFGLSLLFGGLASLGIYLRYLKNDLWV